MVCLKVFKYLVSYANLLKFVIIFISQHEIETLNNDTFKLNCNWLQMLTMMIEEHQEIEDNPLAKRVLEKWIEERDQLR